MSLSPLPLMLIMIALFFGKVGAILIAWAPAWALSIAKRTPSFFAKNFTALSASLSNAEVNSILPDFPRDASWGPIPQ